MEAKLKAAEHQLEQVKSVNEGTDSAFWPPKTSVEYTLNICSTCVFGSAQARELEELSVKSSTTEEELRQHQTTVGNLTGKVMEIQQENAGKKANVAVNLAATSQNKHWCKKKDTVTVTQYPSVTQVSVKVNTA